MNVVAGHVVEEFKERGGVAELIVSIPLKNLRRRFGFGVVMCGDHHGDG